MIWTDSNTFYSPVSNPYWDQGDIVVAPVTALDSGPEGERPETVLLGEPVRRAFWSQDELGRDTTGETTLGPAMIISHGCSLDKEFNRRFEMLRTQGHDRAAAIQLAADDDDLDRRITIAPVFPLSRAAPSDEGTLRANRVIGYFPVCDSPERYIDEGIVDLSRATTIDRALIVDRLGIISDDARATLLYALARYWAYRAPKLTYELEEAMGKRILDVEISKEGGLGVILTLDDESTLSLLQAPVDPGGGPQRPGLTRDSA